MFSDSTVWQIAAGELYWDYSDVFLDNDVMLVGWGGLGRYGSPKFRKAARSRANATGIKTVTRFAEKPAAGDTVILRSGQRAVAIGYVAKPGYSFNQRFRFCHQQRVVWQHQLTGALADLQRRSLLFHGCPRMSTFTAIHSTGILRRISPLIRMFRRRPLQRVKGPSGLSESALRHALREKGLSAKQARAICGVIVAARQLVKEYDDGVVSSEHEIVGHIVLPLLRALGWENRRLSVEYRNMDVVAWDPSLRDVRLVCEAKDVGRSLADVVDQPMRYCRVHRLRCCTRILVTNGRWLWLYKRCKLKGRWSKRRVGRLSIESIGMGTSPSSSKSGVDVLLQLTPKPGLFR